MSEIGISGLTAEMPKETDRAGDEAAWRPLSTAIELSRRFGDFTAVSNVHTATSTQRDTLRPLAHFSCMVFR
jgi:hypothetical protein